MGVSSSLRPKNFTLAFPLFGTLIWMVLFCLWASGTSKSPRFLALIIAIINFQKSCWSKLNSHYLLELSAHRSCLAVLQPFIPLVAFEFLGKTETQCTTEDQRWTRGRDCLEIDKMLTRGSLVCWSSFKWFVVDGWNVSLHFRLIEGQAPAAESACFRADSTMVK